MGGGLVQLTGFGAQNVFVNGNPSMTYFNKMYKRTTNFAMEHFMLNIAHITDTTSPLLEPRRSHSRFLDMLTCSTTATCVCRFPTSGPLSPVLTRPRH